MVHRVSSETFTITLISIIYSDIHLIIKIIFYVVFASLLVPPTSFLPHLHHLYPSHYVLPSYISLLLCLEQLLWLGYSITFTWITSERFELVTVCQKPRTLPTWPRRETQRLSFKTSIYVSNSSYDTRKHCSSRTYS